MDKKPPRNLGDLLGMFGGEPPKKSTQQIESDLLNDAIRDQLEIMEANKQRAENALLMINKQMMCISNMAVLRFAMGDLTQGDTLISGVESLRKNIESFLALIMGYEDGILPENYNILYTMPHVEKPITLDTKTIMNTVERLYQEGAKGEKE